MGGTHEERLGTIMLILQHCDEMRDASSPDDLGAQ